MNIKHFINNLFFKYEKGQIDGYMLGYEVAKEEFSVKIPIVVNLYDDFIKYKDKLSDEYGISYAEKTEEFFQKSNFLRESIDGYLLAHKSHSKLLLSYEDDYRIIYLIKMLTEINLINEEQSLGITKNDLEYLAKAKAYAKLFYYLLKEDDSYYYHFLKKFTDFKNRIQEKEWDKF